MNRSQKMLAARETLRRRLAPKKQLLHPSGIRKHPTCEVRLDRLGIVTSGFPVDAVLRIPGFHRGKSHWLRRRKPEDFLAYGRVARFTSTTSIREMVVLSERQSHRLARYKITMIADDELGLQFEDVCRILELLPDAQTVLVEVAWDFGSDSPVNGAFVREHALFGKSRRRKVAEIPGYDSWGSRRGRQKFVRSYYKPELHAHRLEIQLLARSLQNLGVTDIFHFHRLTGLLSHHVLFSKLDEQKLVAQLRSTGFTATETICILRKFNDHEGDLYAQLSVLSKRAHLTNIRRLLVPLPENQLLEGALRRWLTKWPAVPAQLRDRK